MTNQLKKLFLVWKIKDLRNSILTVLGILLMFRLASHIPIPGVNLEALRALFSSNQYLGLLNVFSGGTFNNFSVVAMGVGPYITASIIVQLLTMVIPALEEIQKEGESGQRRLNQYMRVLTVPLALLQSYGVIQLLRKGSSTPVIADLTAWKYLTVLVVMTAGSLFLMWIGEIISEKKVGNGISLIIFAGIIARLPSLVQQAAVTFDASQIITLVSYVVIGIVTIAGVVFITEAQRNIPVTYARFVRGQSTYGGSTTHLPLRVNMGGVIPIIFAISIILFPPLLAQFFVGARTVWLANFASWVVTISQNRLIYAIAYFVLVIFFTYFYTAVIFRPDQIAENLQKQGGYVPGIRPGLPTAQYLQHVTNRILIVGAVFLAVIAVLPLAVSQLTGTNNLIIGGTSLLIVVSVIIETVQQIEAQLVMREYDVT
jgi:preprotein translocase subunit SecY